MSAPKQITLRHPSPRLCKALRDLSRERGESLNHTILQVLEQALGLDARRERLKELATWTTEDAQSFDQALRSQRAIDPDLWT